MAHRKTLTQAQLDVLEWIADGCPDGVMDGYEHRIGAAALRKRGLVETNGRGPSWTAEITEAGQRYLARAQEPDAPMPRQSNVSVTEQLVSDVEKAGGTYSGRSSEARGRSITFSVPPRLKGTGKFRKANA